MDNYNLLPNFYLPLDKCNVNHDEWMECPICKHKPKLWIFDNGRQAKCGCDKVYGKPSATAISIWDYFNTHKDMSGYSHDDFRDNWNEVVKQRKEA